MMQLPPRHLKVSLIVTLRKWKRPEAIPAYIADWWRDGTAAIETGMATVGHRSGTINTRNAVGMWIKAWTNGAIFLVCRTKTERCGPALGVKLEDERS
jgi:hypothetical protein